MKSFPLLARAELRQILQELGVPCSDQLLLSPAAADAGRMYFALLTRQYDLRGAGPRARWGRGAFTFCCCSALLPAMGVRDFSAFDLCQPGAFRLCAHLSAVVNFARFAQLLHALLADADRGLGRDAQGLRSLVARLRAELDADREFLALRGADTAQARAALEEGASQAAGAAAQLSARIDAEAANRRRLVELQQRLGALDAEAPRLQQSMQFNLTPAQQLRYNTAQVLADTQSLAEDAARLRALAQEHQRARDELEYLRSLQQLRTSSDALQNDAAEKRQQLQQLTERLRALRSMPMQERADAANERMRQAVIARDGARASAAELRSELQRLEDEAQAVFQKQAALRTEEQARAEQLSTRFQLLLRLASAQTDAFSTQIREFLEKLN